MVEFSLWDIVRNLLLAARWTVVLSLIAFVGGGLEAALAAAEGGEVALAFASGMAAGVALLETFPAGSRVLLPDDVYYGYRVAAADLLAQRGVTTGYVAMDDLAALDRALAQGAALVWLETPSNPLL